MEQRFPVRMEGRMTTTRFRVIIRFVQSVKIYWETASFCYG